MAQDLAGTTTFRVGVGDEGAEASSLAELLAIAPELKQPEEAAAAAMAINHLAQGYDLTVIGDPAEFAALYRVRLASEDPKAPWSAHSPCLHDYGAPDFSLIEPPTIRGTILTFYAEDRFLGIPYKVEVNFAHPEVPTTGESYKLMDLKPID